MHVINQSVSLMTEAMFVADAYLTKLEKCARTCYKSQDKITRDSAKKMFKRLGRLGHHSVFEHVHLTAVFITSRRMGNELVRHRHAEQFDDVYVDTAISQQSTRYCDFQKGIEVIQPQWSVNDLTGSYVNTQIPCNKAHWFSLTNEDQTWLRGMLFAEATYKHLRDCQLIPQQAAGALPLDLATEIVITASIRQWRQILNLRMQHAADPQMQALMKLLLAEFHSYGFEVFFPMIYCESERRWVFND